MNLAKIIYEAFPSHETLPIDPDKDLKGLKTLYGAVMAMSVMDLGDSLFRFIVVEAYEAGELRYGHFSPKMVYEALCAGIDDLRAVTMAISEEATKDGWD